MRRSSLVAGGSVRVSLSPTFIASSSRSFLAERASCFQPYAYTPTTVRAIPIQMTASPTAPMLLTKAPSVSAAAAPTMTGRYVFAHAGRSVIGGEWILLDLNEWQGFATPLPDADDRAISPKHPDRFGTGLR